MENCLLKINGRFYFRRRIPKKYRDFDSRREVKVALKTCDKKEALKKATELYQHYDQYWLLLARGRTEEADTHLENAIALAKSLGYSYIPYKDITNMPIKELFGRLTTVKQKQYDSGISDALLGFAEPPKLTVEGALARYLELTVDEIDGKNDEQKRIRFNTKNISMKLLSESLGNKELHLITRNDALNFKEMLFARTKSQGSDRLSLETANKYIGQVSAIFNKLNDRLRLGLSNPFTNLRFKITRVAEGRAAFSVEWLLDKMLCHDTFTHGRGLNQQAAALFLATVETGCRPSELCKLTSSDIVLDSDYPHIIIRDNENGTAKTSSSLRKVPLVGISLRALKAFPDGFPRYVGKPTSAENIVNKYLRTHGLLESEKTTWYSIRHTYVDRLRRSGYPDWVQYRIVGHAVKDIHNTYGDGASLQEMCECARSIALEVPHKIMVGSRNEPELFI